MLRACDIVFSMLGLTFSSPLLMVLLLAGYLDSGSPIFRQQRVGRYQRPFTLFKFRTMNVDAPQVASHLADASSVTRFGRFLRRTKLDELPQLLNVLRGDMSLVGPRPCLFSQEQLIHERSARGVFEARPGITGLAQVSGIDMSTPTLLAEIDAKMLNNLDVVAYFRLIRMTVTGKGAGDRVSFPVK